MCKVVAYLRISTAEERGLQKFTRQEQAIARWCKENGIDIPERRIYKDDASGKSFNRVAWKELMDDINDGDTIVFKEISRFTRERDKGFEMYMELMSKGVNLVFIDNPTLNTEYLMQMQNTADQMKKENIIGGMTLEFVVRLLLVTELDRSEQERKTIVKRINDGLSATTKKSGRAVGKLDKVTDELKADIQAFMTDRTIKQVDLMEKHHISRNTLKKYVALAKEGKLN